MVLTYHEAIVAALEHEVERLRALSQDGTFKFASAESFEAAVNVAAAAYHETECVYHTERDYADAALDAALAARDAARAALDRVRALHKPVWDGDRGVHHCAECGARLTAATPDCPTVAVLDPENFCSTCGAQGEEPCRYVVADSPEIAGLTRVGTGCHPARHGTEGTR